jgi:hypothetical protein
VVPGFAGSDSGSRTGFAKGFSVRDSQPLRFGLDVHFSSAFTAASSFYILFTVREVKAVVV